VVVLDVKKKGFLGGYEIFTHNGNKATGVKLKDFVQKLNEIGIGELVINSIEDDGKMTGFDFKLFDMVRELTDMPMTIMGGAGHLDHIKQSIARYKTIGVAAGSLFVFKGKYRAVLINYPDRQERNELYQITKK
ncbi:MAG: imidazole glycerol phosphate synthase subunit HisF, partial [Flavobacterium sp.]